MINDWIELVADDGHRFRAWRSLPPEEPLGSVIVLATLLWVRPLFSFGFGFHLAAGVALAAIGAWLPERVCDAVLKVFGVASCLYVVPDIWSDTIARSGLRSDARMLAELTGIPTVVMGASFRNTGQIEALAGCDRLTISPDLLQKLDEDQGELPRRLTPGTASGRAEPLTEAQFRWELNEDAMATEKLAEGIRNFHADALKLEKIIGERLAQGTVAPAAE